MVFASSPFLFWNSSVVKASSSSKASVHCSITMMNADDDAKNCKIEKVPAQVPITKHISEASLSSTASTALLSWSSSSSCSTTISNCCDSDSRHEEDENDEFASFDELEQNDGQLVVSTAVTGPMQVREQKKELLFDTFCALYEQEHCFYYSYSSNPRHHGRIDPTKFELAKTTTATAIASTRSRMITWCYEIIDFCRLSHNTTVEICMNYVDRFILTSSNNNRRKCTNSDKVIGSSDDIDYYECNTHIYQLLVVTCLYMAIKIHEPIAMDPKLVCQITQQLYSVNEILAMERMVVASLNWYLNPITTNEYIHIYMKLLVSSPVNEDDGNDSSSDEFMNEIIELANYQCELELYVTESSNVTVPNAVLAYCAFMNAYNFTKRTSDEEDDMYNNYYVDIDDCKPTTTTTISSLYTIDPTMDAKVRMELIHKYAAKQNIGSSNNDDNKLFEKVQEQLWKLVTDQQQQQTNNDVHGYDEHQQSSRKGETTSKKSSLPTTTATEPAVVRNNKNKQTCPSYSPDRLF